MKHVAGPASLEYPTAGASTEAVEGLEGLEKSIGSPEPRSAVAYEPPRVVRTGSLHHLLGKSGPFVDLFGAQPTQP